MIHFDAPIAPETATPPATLALGYLPGIPCHQEFLGGAKSKGFRSKLTGVLKAELCKGEFQNTIHVVLSSGREQKVPHLTGVPEEGPNPMRRAEFPSPPGFNLAEAYPHKNAASR